MGLAPVPASPHGVFGRVVCNGWVDFFFLVFFCFSFLKKGGKERFQQGFNPCTAAVLVFCPDFFFLELFAAAVLTECVGDWFLLHFLKN